MGMLAGAGMMAGGLYGLSQGAPASNVQMPQMFQMPNMGNAANAGFGTIAGLSDYNTWNIPQARNVESSLFHNPYSSGLQQGGNFAGGMGQLGALNQFQTGGQLTNIGSNQLPAWASSVFNTSMDPMNALYNRTLGQVTQQQGAQNAQAGVGTTPYGAGLQDQNLTNFNIDWQNNMLNRQIAGLGAGTSALGAGANIAGVGQGMQQQAPISYLQSAALPYSTFGQIGGGQMAALSGLGNFGQQASQLPQQSIQDYLQYLGVGNQATGAATGVGQLGLNQSGMAFGQNAAYAQAAMGGLGRMGGMTGGLPQMGGMFQGPSSGWGTQGMGGWQ
jgi:hypothetical protein